MQGRIRAAACLSAISAALALPGCGNAGRDEHEGAACTPPASPVLIEGGDFLFGSDETYPEEGPARSVHVESFWIDPTEVTVGAFRKFVEMTGYVTTAEKPADPASVSGIDLANTPEAAEFFKPGGAVFSPNPNLTPGNLNWWAYVPGADWRHPRGPDMAAARNDEPVTQISFADAAAFAAWAGGRLPTEAEWEFAALAGGKNADATSKPPQNANSWQGVFPLINNAEDGFEGVAPVGCFAPNDNGLYDMLGNVWEWTADAYAPRHDFTAGAATPPMHVIKGGSFLCAENYCVRYRPAARQAQETGLGTNHIGFRVAYDRLAGKS